MAIDLSTAGVKLYRAVETTPGTRPTTGYTHVPGIKSVPELNPEPDNLETTTLEATEYRTYIPGLKDIGGALSFGANLTQELMDTWGEVMEEYDTASGNGNAMWWCIVVPGLTESLFFPGQPSPLGMPAMEVSSVLETNLYITPTGEPTWETKPTNLDETV